MIDSLKEKVKSIKPLLNIIRKFFYVKIFNVHGTQHKKNALISYSVFHFKNRRSVKHSNYSESIVIAKLLSNKGFNVDVINADQLCKIDYDKYDLIIGEGLPLFQALKLKARALIVYYATGSHPWQCTEASLERLVDYYKTSGMLADESLRVQNYKWGVAASCAPYIFCIGNKRTANTFVKHNAVGELSLVNPSFIRTVYKIQEKNEDKLKNFLYFGSAGMLHKGLDLVIEAVKSLPGVRLLVCGYTEGESKFINSLNIPTNVKVEGFVNISSPRFSEICNEYAYVILPSVSEGVSTSILTAVGNGGLIPIITAECGIDLELEFVIEISEPTVEMVTKAIESTFGIPLKTYSRLSAKAHQYVEDNYSQKMYEERMNELLDSLPCVRPH